MIRGFNSGKSNWCLSDNRDNNLSTRTLLTATNLALVFCITQICILIKWLAAIVLNNYCSCLHVIDSIKSKIKMNSYRQTHRIILVCSFLGLLVLWRQWVTAKLIKEINQSMANVNADYGLKTILTDKYNSCVFIVLYVIYIGDCILLMVACS